MTESGHGHTANDRRERVLSFVKSRGHATVAELVSALGVSESTIKRDLRALDARHMLVRTRGGAFLPADGQVLVPFEIRLQERYSEKLKIAREAARFVGDNDSVFIEAGTTTYLAFKNITARDVTVITNSIPILTSVDRLSGLRVHVIEGEYLPDSMSIHGAAAVRSVESILPKKLIVGSAFVHPQLGLTTNEAQDRPLKSALIERAQTVILVADSSKIGKIGTWRVASFDNIGVFITDSGISEEAHRQISVHGTRVIVV